MNMVQQTKAYYQLPDKGLASPLKVIIAQRPDKPVAARSLTNAPQLASALQKRGLHVEVMAAHMLCIQPQRFSQPFWGASLLEEPLLAGTNPIALHQPACKASLRPFLCCDEH